MVASRWPRFQRGIEGVRLSSTHTGHTWLRWHDRPISAQAGASLRKERNRANAAVIKDSSTGNQSAKVCCLVWTRRSNAGHYPRPTDLVWPTVRVRLPSSEAAVCKSVLRQRKLCGVIAEQVQPATCCCSRVEQSRRSNDRSASGTWRMPYRSVSALWTCLRYGSRLCKAIGHQRLQLTNADESSG